MYTPPFTLSRTQFVPAFEVWFSLCPDKAVAAFIAVIMYYKIMSVLSCYMPPCLECVWFAILNSKAFAPDQSSPQSALGQA